MVPEPVRYACYYCLKVIVMPASDRCHPQRVNGALEGMVGERGGLSG